MQFDFFFFSFLSAVARFCFTPSFSLPLCLHDEGMKNRRKRESDSNEQRFTFCNRSMRDECRKRTMKTITRHLLLAANRDQRIKTDLNQVSNSIVSRIIKRRSEFVCVSCQQIIIKKKDEKLTISIVQRNNKLTSARYILTRAKVEPLERSNERMNESIKDSSASAWRLHFFDRSSVLRWN